MTWRVAVLLAGAAAAAACALTPPLDPRGADPALTPERAARQGSGVLGRPAYWGGAIVRAVNLRDDTQLEVLAYPLDRLGRPRTGETPVGRFLALRSGYLETALYTAGRLVTVVGPVVEIRRGVVGEVDYTYPVVRGEQMHLWAAVEMPTRPRFQLGLGVGF